MEDTLTVQRVDTIEDREIFVRFPDDWACGGSETITLEQFLRGRAAGDVGLYHEERHY